VKLTLCILLWARPGAEDGLAAYEDRVLRIVPEHGGRILQRARGSGTAGQPLEIQLLEFPSAQALDAFTTDDRRQSLAAERDKVIAKTEIIEVQLVQGAPEPSAPAVSGDPGQAPSANRHPSQ
jgi:uncharacterized protein (DUF1330 family)